MIGFHHGSVSRPELAASLLERSDVNDASHHAAGQTTTAEVAKPHDRDRLPVIPISSTEAGLGS